MKYQISKNTIRTSIAVLVLSAGGLITIASHEGYRSEAYVPVVTAAGSDVPTIGFGSTTNSDGSRVAANQRTNPVAALKRLGEHVEVFEEAVKRCAPVPMHQYEFDAYVSLTYNIGSNAFCKSTLVKKLNSYDYDGACKEILKWDKFKGNSLPGLTKRRTEEYKICIGE
jgi:lysozyme